jgi:hypothetical protein
MSHATGNSGRVPPDGHACKKVAALGVELPPSRRGAPGSSGASGAARSVRAAAPAGGAGTVTAGTPTVNPGAERVTALPPALLGEVLSFLDGRSLARAECASRVLRDAARDSSAWLSALRGEGGAAIIETLAIATYPTLHGATRVLDAPPRNGHIGAQRLWSPAVDARCARSAYLARMRDRAAAAAVASEYASAWTSHARLRPARTATLTALRWAHTTLGVTFPPIVFMAGLILLVLRLDGIPNFSEWSWMSQLKLVACGPGLLLADGVLAALVLCVRLVFSACPACDVFTYARCDGPWPLLLLGGTANGGGPGGPTREEEGEHRDLVGLRCSARGVFLVTYVLLLTAFPLLIGAKLDGALPEWSWTAVLFPLWCLLPMTCYLARVVTAALEDVGLGPNERKFAQLALQCGSACALLTAACVAANLDRYGAVFSWAVAFTPIWVFDAATVGVQLLFIARVNDGAAMMGVHEAGRQRRTRICYRAALVLGVAALDALLMGSPLLIVTKLEGLHEEYWLLVCLPMLVAASAACLVCIAVSPLSLDAFETAAEFVPPRAPTAAAAFALPWRLANQVAV